MARIHTKHKRRHFNLFKFSMYCFMFMFSAFLLTSTLLRAYNVQVSVQLQNKREAVVMLQRSNHLLNVELQALRSKERVMAIAEAAGLSSNQENIIIISKGD